jgi:hydroxyproline O-arabinosyltransferase
MLQDPTEDRSYHVVITAQGSAVHWQSRIAYYWYLKTRKQCQEAAAMPGGKPCHMGGFTRVLHSGMADDLMDEIPTYVAQTLPPEHPDHGYIVLNRPWAFVQWVRDAKIKEKYVLMSEPDHVWLKPMPNLMVGQRPAAFPFFYIEPSKKEFLPITRRFVGDVTRKQAEQIAPIGNAPTLMSMADMEAVVPLWFNLSIAVHNDEGAVKEWGWVQEMYAFTLALYKAGVRKTGLHVKMMSQPPWDDKLGPYYILHYTYGMDYTKKGVFTPGEALKA